MTVFSIYRVSLDPSVSRKLAPYGLLTAGGDAEYGYEAIAVLSSPSSTDASSPTSVKVGANRQPFFVVARCGATNARFALLCHARVI